MKHCTLRFALYLFISRFCPFAQRTILVLLAKQMPFDVVNINLKKKPAWFLEKTYGTVSVVKYKGNYVMESLVNSDFVDEVIVDGCCIKP